ncbi:alpha/beta hydrolase [soil metagenome]
MSNTQRRLIVAALALAALAWFKLAPHRSGDDAKPTASATPSAQSADADPTTAAPDAITRQVGKIGFTPCTLAPAFGTQSVEALCGSFEVLENRAAPAGRKIRLAVAWLPAKGEAEPDPMVMLAGGPGQSALETFPTIANAFADLRKHRNVLLVDQRGTGGSNKLRCKDEDEDKNGDKADSSTGTGDASVPSPASLETDLANARAATERCVAQLSKIADLRFYSTTDAIQDLDEVRAAIDADKLNLMGVSYGTRVAQQYAKRYPGHVRTITIDGIAPNSLVLGNTMARTLESSLDRQFARCAKDPKCESKLGDPRSNLNTLMQTLRTAPPKVTFRDAITGESRTETLTTGHIAGVARLFAYIPQIAGLLPLELNEAAHGRYEPLMALANLLRTTVGDQITDGMQFSVICTEDAGELKVEPADVGSLLGTDLVTAMQTACAVWPHGERPAGFRAPLTGNLPVLILSGEFDPVTPPAFGDEVLKSLGNARHLVVRGQGHNVLPVGCVPKLFTRFVETADAKSLDVHCLDKVPYAAPFTGFYGWEP